MHGHFFFFLKGEGCRILTITVSTVLMIMIVLTTLMMMIGLKNMTLTTMLTVSTSMIISKLVLWAQSTTADEIRADEYNSDDSCSC